MTARRLLLSFEDADALVAAARELSGEGVPGMDAHTPWRVEELDEALAIPAPSLRPVMLGAGLGAALAIFALQVWSAVWFYPINSGGRPLFSWPAFGFPTFEAGILAAAFGGFAAMLWKCGLPKLNDPFFATDKTRAASDAGFFLSLPAADAPDRLRLSRLGGLREVIEVAP